MTSKNNPLKNPVFLSKTLSYVNTWGKIENLLKKNATTDFDETLSNYGSEVWHSYMKQDSEKESPDFLKYLELGHKNDSKAMQWIEHLGFYSEKQLCIFLKKAIEKNMSETTEAIYLNLKKKSKLWNKRFKIIEYIFEENLSKIPSEMIVKLCWYCTVSKKFEFIFLLRYGYFSEALMLAFSKKNKNLTIFKIGDKYISTAKIFNVKFSDFIEKSTIEKIPSMKNESNLKKFFDFLNISPFLERGSDSDLKLSSLLFIQPYDKFEKFYAVVKNLNIDVFSKDMFYSDDKKYNYLKLMKERHEKNLFLKPEKKMEVVKARNVISLFCITGPFPKDLTYINSNEWENLFGDKKYYLETVKKILYVSDEVFGFLNEMGLSAFNYYDYDRTRHSSSAYDRNFFVNLPQNLVDFLIENYIDDKDYKIFENKQIPPKFLLISRLIFLSRFKNMEWFSQIYDYVSDKIPKNKSFYKELKILIDSDIIPKSNSILEEKFIKNIFNQWK